MEPGTAVKMQITFRRRAESERRGGGRLISAQITIYSCTNCIRNLNLAAEISKNDLMTAELTFCGEILTLRDYNCRARNSGRCWKISSIKILSYYFINGISAICKS